VATGEGGGDVVEIFEERHTKGDRRQRRRALGSAPQRCPAHDLEWADRMNAAGNGERAPLRTADTLASTPAHAPLATGSILAAATSRPLVETVEDALGLVPAERECLAWPEHP